jgi:hypothetical protein
MEHWSSQKEMLLYWYVLEINLIKLTIISFCILKNFIIQTTMCFSLLNEESFFQFVYLLDPRYVPPDRKTIRHRIEVEYESQRGFKERVS